MLKRATLSLAAALLLSGAAQAGDDLFEQIAGASPGEITDAVSEVEAFDLDGVNVDQWASDAGDDAGADAIEACFRRIGYRHHGGWGYGYRRCYWGYPSYYTYHCYRPVSYYSYSHCYTPCYTSYWGCY